MTLELDDKTEPGGRFWASCWDDEPTAQIAPPQSIVGRDDGEHPMHRPFCANEDALTCELAAVEG